jgi:hypothetical protein
LCASGTPKTSPWTVRSARRLWEGEAWLTASRLTLLTAFFSLSWYDLGYWTLSYLHASLTVLVNSHTPTRCLRFQSSRMLGILPSNPYLAQYKSGTTYVYNSNSVSYLETSGT